MALMIPFPSCAKRKFNAVAAIVAKLVRNQRSFSMRTFSLLAVSFVLIVSGCRPAVQHRPFGYIRLGLIKDFLAPETYVKEDQILVRHDERGFSAMSTMCSRDLSHLALMDLPTGEKIWASKFSSSSYHYDGAVRTGPAVADLPYYELTLSPGEYQGPADTLYVVVGQEKPKDWRLQVKPPR